MRVHHHQALQYLYASQKRLVTSVLGSCERALDGGFGLLCTSLDARDPTRQQRQLGT